ncbi:unnamed protein product [Prunus armeniaca]
MLEETIVHREGKLLCSPRPTGQFGRTLRARDVSSLRKKCRLPSVVIKSSSKKISYAEKTKKQRATDFPYRSLSRLHLSKDEDRTGKAASFLSKLTPPAELREVKCGVGPKLMAFFEGRMPAEKGSTSARADGPMGDKPGSVRDACVSYLLKMNFMLYRLLVSDWLIIYVKSTILAHFQTFLRRNKRMRLLLYFKKELDKKNTALTDLLSTEQKQKEMKISYLKRNMSLLKSSLAMKDCELDSSAAALNE